MQIDTLPPKSLKSSSIPASTRPPNLKPAVESYYCITWVQNNPPMIITKFQLYQTNSTPLRKPISRSLLDSTRLDSTRVATTRLDSTRLAPSWLDSTSSTSTHLSFLDSIRIDSHKSIRLDTLFLNRVRPKPICFNKNVWPKSHPKWKEKKKWHQWNPAAWELHACSCCGSPKSL